MSYDAIHRRSLEDPQGFWGEVAEGVSWTKKWDNICDQSREPFARWFAGAELNSCYNALDRHVESGRADQAALIYESPVTSTTRIFTYAELLDLVSRCAGGLAERGVAKGDRVVIYMPAVPEAVIAMLACARLGAIHSVVFGGFAANELATRIDDATPKAIISASCGIEGARHVAYKPMLDAAIDLAHHKPDFCVILQRPQVAATMKEGRDIEWSAAQGAPVGCVTVGASDPL